MYPSGVELEYIMVVCMEHKKIEDEVLRRVLKAESTRSAERANSITLDSSGMSVE